MCEEVEIDGAGADGHRHVAWVATATDCGIRLGRLRVELQREQHIFNVVAHRPPSCDEVGVDVGDEVVRDAGAAIVEQPHSLAGHR